jgi:hypothetical protein
MMCGISMGGWKENCREVGNDCRFDLDLKRLRAFRVSLKCQEFQNKQIFLDVVSGLSDCQNLQKIS